MYKILHTKYNRKIAYKYHNGKSSIGFIFFSGFKSDMKGNKAQYIFKWCKINNIECTIFDYSGHGKSSEDFINCNLSIWTEDAIEIIKNITSNPQVIIGSSMGAWIAIKAALKIPKKIKGLVTIAAAPDFTKDLWDKDFNNIQKNELNKKGYILINSIYDSNGYIITKNLIEDGNKNLLLKTNEIKLNCPIKLIHGEKDIEVSWKKSFEIFKKIKSEDAELIIIKNGDHRMSTKKNLKTIIEISNSLISHIN
tara:strand:+ start:570 stop:1325 length:756 start_codon:yes stop_codon:yes gene_type:complete